MGVFNPASGVLGSVIVGATEYNFGKWSVPIETALVPVNNFSSAFQLLVAGLTKGGATIEGPWDVGNMPLTSGESYVFKFYVNVDVYVSFVALVGKITPSTDIEGAARVEVQLGSTGSFTAGIV